MSSTKVLLFKSKKKSDGRYPIAIRIIKDRKAKYLFLDWIQEKQWSESKMMVKSSHPNYKQLNNLILQKHAEISDLILEADAQKKHFTTDYIIKMVKGNRKEVTFSQLGEEFIREQYQAGKMSRAVSDGSHIDVIKRFVNESELYFQDIDEAFLRKLKAYLLGERKVSERTVMNYFVVIRTLFNRAIQEGVVDQKYYPFGKGKIRIKYPETIKIGLDEEEIKAIEALELEISSGIWHTRNVFLFSFYLAGMRVSDVLKIRWSEINDSRIQYKMGKNNKVDSLKLPDKVVEIIAYYQDQKKSHDDFIFPELRKADLSSKKDIHSKIRTADKKFNTYLNQIAKLIDTNKKITMHIARHSFGNIAGDRVSPQMLQKLYRHSSLTTTIGYQGNFIHKDADDALDTIVGF
ncbi:MAG: site-specific integrase [Bacteroidetes bacterium]|nr:site-specific integrase [Bacteroidota bacterium]